MIDYLCPKCKKILERNCKSLVCSQNHVYDLSSDGYVNLYSGKIQGGDSREMVRARRSFLTAGYYQPLASKLAQIIKENYLQRIVDLGCGEGYYDRVILENTNAEIFGVDLSKEAVRLASKAVKNVYPERTSYCVASIFEMPFEDEIFDAALSVFAPVPDMEAHRLLSKNGRMIVVTPGKDHLNGLKSAVYENPYENSEKDKEYALFEKGNVHRVYSEIQVEGESISNLFLMTPYYWKTSESDAMKLKNLSRLDTVIDFIITEYIRI